MDTSNPHPRTDRQPGPHSHLLETGLRRECLASGDFLHVMRDDVRLPDGTTASREFIVHPGAVMIIALLDDDRLVMERQFRYPMGKAMVEFPAGKLDAGESSLACAQRELREETGYVAQEWACAGVVHPVISYSTEHIDVWFARGLTLGQRELDAGEFLDVFSATQLELMACVQNGLLTDAKTLAGLLWLQRVRAGDWTLNWLPASDEAQATPCGPYVPHVAMGTP